MAEQEDHRRRRRDRRAGRRPGRAILADPTAASSRARSRGTPSSETAQGARRAAGAEVVQADIDDRASLDGARSQARTARSA